MDFNLKTYKCFKIKRYFKTIHFFCFFHGTSISNENWVKIEQIFANNGLTYFRILNKIMINTLSNSIFKNLTLLIHGPIILLNSNNANLTFKELENINPSMKLLGFRLNNRVYSKKQVEKLKKLSYLENISGFHNSLKVFTKIPYYKFKSKKLTSLSK